MGGSDCRVVDDGVSGSGRLCDAADQVLAAKAGVHTVGRGRSARKGRRQLRRIV